MTNLTGLSPMPSKTGDGKTKIRILWSALALGMAAFGSVPVSADDETCVSCHSAEARGHANQLTNTHAGMTCASCHGDSLDHRASRGAAAPDVSFGPRWSSSPALQDDQCLQCHQKTVARHWNDALHMANNVTCISCHDLHASEDPVLADGGQISVCTTCHKTQKSGIHGREKMVGMNPPCTSCHNPHADQRPQGVMLANDSAGCRRCHNLQSLTASESVGKKARSYHSNMKGGENICIDCHVRIAHGDPDAFEPFIPLPRSEREITLFHPGKSDVDWLLTRHAGAQLLRQGTNCRQCHRGDEVALGAALRGPEPATRQVRVHYSIDNDALVTSISWEGTADETGIAMMWGFGEDRALQRGGCWAACHGDMAGMNLDRGDGIDKYLWSYRSPGQDADEQDLVRSDKQLRQEIESGHFAELWRVDLQQSVVTVSALLAGISSLKDTGVTGKAAHENGEWKVVIKRPLAPTAPLLPIQQGRAYTFGVALHGLGRTGSDHWVSLPMTLSMDDEDTDFITD